MGNIVIPKMFGQMLNLGHWSTDGLVFYWRGIEAGNAVDESLYGNHGTITGATWVGDGLSFDGISDYVIMPTKKLFTINGTILVKARINTLLNGRYLLQEETGGYITWDINSGALRVRIFDTAFTDFSAVTSDNLWHTYILTWDTTQTSIYVDGRLAQSDNTFIGLNAAPQEGHTLAADRLQSNRLHCDISRHIIYSRALSAFEIQALTINPNLPMEQTPIWQMLAPPEGIVPIIQAHTRRRRAG